MFVPFDDREWGEEPDEPDEKPSLIEQWRSDIDALMALSYIGGHVAFLFMALPYTTGFDMAATFFRAR